MTLTGLVGPPLVLARLWLNGGEQHWSKCAAIGGSMLTCLGFRRGLQAKTCAGSAAHPLHTHTWRGKTLGLMQGGEEQKP